MSQKEYMASVDKFLLHWLVHKVPIYWCSAVTLALHSFERFLLENLANTSVLCSHYCTRWNNTKQQNANASNACTAQPNTIIFMPSPTTGGGGIMLLGVVRQCVHGWVCPGEHNISWITLQLWCSWKQRWTDLILRSKGQGHDQTQIPSMVKRYRHTIKWSLRSYF